MAKTVRTEQEIFDELAWLCLSPGYPPDMADSAIELVFMQVESLGIN